MSHMGEVVTKKGERVLTQISVSWEKLPINQSIHLSINQIKSNILYCRHREFFSWAKVLQQLQNSTSCNKQTQTVDKNISCHTQNNNAE